MVDGLLHFGSVISSLLLFVMVPFLPITYTLFRDQQWPKILFSAMVMGCCLQAASGMVWSHLRIQLPPAAQIGVLAIAWLLLLGLAFRAAGKRHIVVCTIDDEPIHPGLIVILVLGFVVRAIHPLEVAYLGQSDAYTHLNYVRDIIDSGLLNNPVYPAGYHWILALPSLVFSIDPYYTARFAGAFFGTGLVLGIYVFLEQCIDRRTAVFGSFCAAAFPGMVLLMKTGVGSFANQFGLMLLPAVFMFYVLSVSVRNSTSGNGLLLVISMLGLAAAVPMMLLHVLLIVGLERLVMLVRNRREWLGTTFRTVLLLLPSIFLFTFHITQLGGGQRFETVEMMTRYDLDNSSTVKKIADLAEKKIATLELKPETRKVADIISQSPYFDLLTDYLSIKRKGFGNTRLNLVAAALVVFFFIFLLVGVAREGPAYVILGLWGLLTCIQATTGFLQFSAYQREGWSLLIATCCLCGIIASRLYRVIEHIRFLRLAVLIVMAVSFIWTLTHPPFHFPLWSGAENELVKTIRYIGDKPWLSTKECKAGRHDSMCDIAPLLRDDLEVSLVTRRFVGWGNQGEIALNVMPPDKTAPVHIFDSRMEHDIFHRDRQYVVLIDERNRLSAEQMIGVFAMVTPFMVEATIKNRERMLRLNEDIIRQMNQLDDSRWDITRVQISDLLFAYTIVPVG